LWICGFAGVEVTREDRLADTETLPQLFDILWLEQGKGGKTGFVEGPHCRLVNLSIAPTLYIAVAEEWIDSNASLLNLGLVAIANLHPVALSSQAIHLKCRQAFVYLGQLAEVNEFIVLDIGPILLSEQVFIDPIATRSQKSLAAQPRPWQQAHSQRLPGK